MGKFIENLGIAKLPYDKIFKLCESKSTIIEWSYDTERSSLKHIRNKKDMNLMRSVVSLYNKKKESTYFVRYYNKKFIELIPSSFWTRFQVHKDTARIVIQKQAPGTFSIPHVDIYYNFAKQNNVDQTKRKLPPRTIKRLLIPLTEPHLGHALFVGSDVAYDIKKGTVLKFNGTDVPHSACNAGYEDRYIMSVTGFHIPKKKFKNG